MKKSNHNITDWLDQYGDPEIDKFVEKNLAITEKVRVVMEAKGWKSQDLAKAMDKTPSEVSKWLSGMHNLTLKSIIKMEQALGICLVHTEPIKQYKYVYLGTIKGADVYAKKVNDYQESYADQAYEIAL